MNRAQIILTIIKKRSVFLDDILSGVVFQLVGATVRWGVYRIVSLFTGNNPPSFVDIYDGTNEDDSHVFSGNALLNGIIGFFFGFGALFLIFWLSISL